MSSPYRRSNGRVQLRVGVTGRFRRATLADMGLAAEVCETCRGIIPRALGELAPETCTHCGAVFVRERCEHVAKTPPRFLGPEDLADVRAGAFDPCGAPAIACDIASRAGRCAEHVEGGACGS